MSTGKQKCRKWMLLVREKVNMYKIAIISAYFGPLPNYVKYWMQSAALNGDIDFYIVNDHAPNKHPTNVHFISMNLSDFSMLASRKIGLQIQVKEAYKCCDFKCAFGLIFEDYLREYDFWAHCDLDLVWGDLRKFLNDDVLSQYDKIYPLGHLALYRNNEMMKRAFMLSGSEKGTYDQIFTSDKHFAFDELRGIYKILEKNNIPQYDRYEFADISPVYSRMKIVTNYTCYSNNYKHQIFVRDGRSIVRYYLDKKGCVQSDEFAYIHFQKRKFTDEQLIADPNESYIITAKGFFPMRDHKITKQLISRYNRYPGKFYEWLEWKDRNYHIIHR